MTVPAHAPDPVHAPGPPAPGRRPLATPALALAVVASVLVLVPISYVGVQNLLALGGLVLALVARARGEGRRATLALRLSVVALVTPFVLVLGFFGLTVLSGSH